MNSTKHCYVVNVRFYTIARANVALPNEQITLNNDWYWILKKIIQV